MFTDGMQDAVELGPIKGPSEGIDFITESRRSFPREPVQLIDVFL